MDPVTLVEAGVSAAATAAEGASAAAGAVGGAAQAVEAGAGLANAVEGAVGTTEAAELVANAKAVDTISELASTAETSADLMAGESALKEVLNIVEESPQTVKSVETPLQSESALSSTKIETKLTKWDQEHPAPDQKTDPEGYKKWCEQRWDAEIDYIADTKTELSMAEWDKQNPEPDKTKNPQEHEEWSKNRSKQEQSLREKIVKEIKQQKENELAETIAQINRYKHLLFERVDIQEGLKALREKVNKTDQDKIDLAKFRVRLSEIEIEINMLEAELKAKLRNSPPLIALMIASAFATAQIYKAGKTEGIV